MRRLLNPPSIIRSDASTTRLVGARTPELDEMPAPTHAAFLEGVAATERKGRPCKPLNKAASNKPLHLALVDDKAAADPRYAKALKLANKYRARRIAELRLTHAGVMPNVTATMVASAARILAASMFTAELAGDAIAKGSEKEATRLFALSASLADKSRTLELTALALLERETVQRKPEHTPNQESLTDIQARILKPLKGGKS